MKIFNHWNELGVIINSTKHNKIKYTERNGIFYSNSDMAEILLGQLNTAGGSIIKPEIEKFFEFINTPTL